MSQANIYEYFERIANLLRTDARKVGGAKALQPVQLEALHYLSKCNAYSNTPAAVAEYLGLTKGTVSQTLGVLEMSGLIEKRPDSKDRRVVHLTLTDRARQLIEESIPPRTLRVALDLLSLSEVGAMEQSLDVLLRTMQQANGLRSFGPCESCRHHRIAPDGSRSCGLTGESLGKDVIEKICREHEFPAGSAA